ncbi:unnamed protein product [Allacma fusca]|uniref:tRNA (34-2'-O)-methyltransferase regulator WDR6 n=1 Tax=Allacma fusca TaxID=39272 RepID=A0A8J2JCT8_9HEXA|nr:unnamed protein product [Allacma fusca]
MIDEPVLLAQCRPITCIELTEDYIIVCEGPGVSIFSREGVKLHQACLFPLDKTILGTAVLRVNDGYHLLFAFGQNFSKVFHCSRTFGNICSVITSLGDGRECLSDSSYIAARWLNNGKKLAALTDENVLHIYEWNSVLAAAAEMDISTKNITRKVIRGVQTSLFSATLDGTCEDDLLVFSGTNLSQIYVWFPQDSTKSYHLLVEGIKGSVLSLKYSEENQILVASSDQRSVFAWKLECSECSGVTKPTAVAFIHNWVTVTFIAEMIGHTGRVWQVDILKDHIISAGQDSNLLLWDTTGRLKKIFSGPSVVNIRCCRLESNRKSVVSGSDDGSVCRWNLTDPFSMAALELPSSLTQSEEKDYPRQVVFYDYQKLLVAMNSGKFVIMGKDGSLALVFSDEELSSYSTFSISPDRNVVIIGSKTGWLYVISIQVNESVNDTNVAIGSCLQKIQFDSKVVSLHFADVETIVLSTCTAVYALQLTINQFRTRVRLSIVYTSKTAWLQVLPNPSLDIIQTVESCLTWNAKLINSSKGSFVCGFSENDFVVLDLIEDRIVKKFPCGGAHRSWDVAVDSLFSFAFIRHKQLTLSEFGLDSTNVQNGVFGGKTINVIATCPDLIDSTKEGYQNIGMLTAGEDAFLRFSRALIRLLKTNEPNVLTTKVAKFKCHASSVRVIKFHHLKEDNALLIFSGGGRSQIVASFLQSKNGNVTWNKRASVMLQTSYNSRNESSDPDMRIMDISVKAVQEDHYSLVCACSDGYLRLVDFQRRRFSLISTFNQHLNGNGEMHAFTQVGSFDRLSLIYGCNSVGELILFDHYPQGRKTTSLDECCSLLKLTKTNEAGITSLLIVREPAKREDYILTGSDDGVVKVFRMPLSDEGDDNLKLELLFEDRIHHSAAVNSIVVTEHKLVLAASADQVVTVRKLDGSVLKSFRCGVSDVQSMAVAELTLDSLLILLVGQGFEMRVINV